MTCQALFFSVKIIWWNRIYKNKVHTYNLDGNYQNEREKTIKINLCLLKVGGWSDLELAYGKSLGWRER